MKKLKILFIFALLSLISKKTPSDMFSNIKIFDDFLLNIGCEMNCQKTKFSCLKN